MDAAELERINKITPEQFEYEAAVLASTERGAEGLGALALRGFAMMMRKSPDGVIWGVHPETGSLLGEWFVGQPTPLGALYVALQEEDRTDGK